MKFRSDRARIAIIGAAYRMPGVGAEGFWHALNGGRDLISSVDPARWDQDAYLHPRKSEPGTSYTFAAGSIGDVSGFDAAFFGISPREAEQMDPQQRILLEMSWEAFESARVPPSSLRGRRCGVYIGLSSVDYAYRRADDLASVDATTMTGNTGSIAANRISYFFDLRGPSMAVDTACSSSLVALHQACQSIRHGESDAALVGGISLHLHPYAFVGFSKASMLSPEGRCRVFDAHADGYVRAEGGAVVLLKPLAQAIADGDPVLGVIIETGINNDGRKNGLTVPSCTAQAALLCETYERAAIAPEEIDYFEAHGTGTAVGDPIETRAIGEALGQRRAPDRPLPIGSVKSHVGHLEAASGMAGLIKALGVLRHRYVPPNLHLSHPSEHIDFGAWNLSPVTTSLALPTDRRLIVGVSAFGFGGTNAHVVLSSFEAPAARKRAGALPEAPLVLSARSPGALKESAGRMAEFLRQRADLAEYDVAYSAVITRDRHPYRLSAEAADREALTQSLERFAAAGTAPGIITGKLFQDGRPPAFVFSGNGSQWAGMGVALLEEERVFRETVEEIDSLLLARGGRSVIADLRSVNAASGFEPTEVAQPALFALQAGLARSLEARGIRPAAVCGHSVGEVAAAWASGALTLEAAVRVIHERSAHQAKTRGSGRMAAVALGEAEMTELIDSLGLAGRANLAAVNSPVSITVAGDEEAIIAISQTLARRRIACRQLPLDYAFHSRAMDAIRGGLLAGLEGLECGAGALPFFSAVAGATIESAALGAEYWWRNIREPVRFEKAIRAMLEAGINTFVEIGPRPVLLSYIEDTARLAGASVLTLPTLSAKDPGAHRIATVACQLELTGPLEDLRRHFSVPGKAVELPHYPWQRERFWHPSTSDSLGLLQRRRVHPLLGYALPGEPLHWENPLDAASVPGLADHKVAGAVVFPAAGFLEMALAAAAAHRPGATYAIEDLEIVSALVLEPDRSKLVRLRVDADDGTFTIRSRDRAAEGEWRTHVLGRLVEDAVPAPAEPLTLPSRAPDVVANAHYERAHSMGLEYGPAFQSVTGVWLADAESFGALTLPECVADGADRYLLHPSIFDGALQLLLDCAAAREALKPGEPPPTYLPVRIDRVELVQPHRAVSAARVVARTSRHQSRRSLHADLLLYDAAGDKVALARGVRFRAARVRHGVERCATWIRTHAIAAPRGAGALALPSPAEAAMLCAQRLHEPARAASRLRFAGEVEPLLDALCGAFAERALRELAGDAPLDPTEWQARGIMTSDAMPLARTLLQMLVEDGVLKAESGRWEWTGRGTEMHFPEPRDIWGSLIGDYPDYAPVIIRTGTAGARLIESLRTGVAGARADHGAAESAFSWVHACTQGEAVALFRAIEDVIASAAAAQPPEGRLRVLQVVGPPAPEELGDVIVPQLDPDRCEFVLAAASQETLEHWRARHPRVAGLESRVIDVDGAGAYDAQVAGRLFDILVLNDGWSAAPDAAQRLQAVRRLLHPGGLLIALEQHPSRAEELRLPSARSIRRVPSAWAPLLGHAGFSDLETVLDAPERAVGPYLVLARAHGPLAAVNDAEATSAPPQTWLLVHDAQGYSASLAAALSAALTGAGQTVIRAVSGAQFACDAPHRLMLDASSSEHWERAIGELRRMGSSPDGWIHLAGLDPTTGAASAATRLAAQENRAAVLLAWLKAAARHSLDSQSCIIAAQAGLALLPDRVRAAGNGGEVAVPDAIRGAALWGLTRVAMQELASQHIRWIDLVDPLADPLAAAADAARLARELLEPDEEDEILLTTAGRYAVRLQPLAELPPPASTSDLPPVPARLDFPVPGSFRHLEWREDERYLAAEPALGEGEVEIDVRAAGLNFRDVMYAMGLLPDEAIEDGFCGPALGMEVAGIVRRVGPGVELTPGAEVMGVAPAALAQRVITRAFGVALKPAEWSFAAAATVPTAFFTVYCAFTELARLKPGERVLIHGAAGGVGMAAIQLARHLGAEVFATAGTVEKRQLVRLLGADHVFDSRSLRFADELLQATGGAGVDVVLNSLAGEAMRRNLRVLKPFGRMVELGKRDFYENTRLGLRSMRNNITYFAFDADQLMARRPEVAQRMFGELMALFATGVLRPIPYRAFCASNVEAAFRQMQASRHVGKIVITLPEGFRPVSHAATAGAPQLRADATYLVTGGLSGFGLRTAQWLASRGARQLVLMSRTAAVASEGEAALAELSRAGIAIECVACDVTDRAALETVLERLRASLPPLRGVVHAAALIEDALIPDMSREQLHRVLAPKIAGALNLHEVTLGCELDFFVLYSSATTLFGNPGQGAYVAANMSLEALAAERRARGLPATCVAFGPIADAGYLARHERVRDALVGRIGGRALQSEEALRALDAVLAHGVSAVGYLELDWGVLGRFLPGAQAPKFAELARLASRRAAGGESAADLRRALKELPDEELLGALTDFVRRQVAGVLRIAPERIETGAQLQELGMDSLMAVELAASVEDTIGVPLSALSLGDAPTVERIAARLAQQLRPAHDADPASNPTRAASADGLEEQVRATAARHASEMSDAEAAGFSADLRHAAAAPLTAGKLS
ncbi:MAG: SDR family NAD(P)-dependent oxidoreductase [Steroidobacteraceae bacterium]